MIWVDSYAGLLTFLDFVNQFKESELCVTRKTLLGARFQSVQHSLNGADLSVPKHPATLSEGRPAICVLILPGSGRSGMLETLLCETFSGTLEDECITSFFDCIAEAGVGEIRRPAKARAWAYLTTRAEPHHSVGYATTKGYWGDLDQPAFSVVRSFLKELCQGDISVQED